MSINDHIRLDRIRATMDSVAASLKLPENHKHDLTQDKKDLSRWDGHKLIWLLRTNGTVMVPAQLGADPTFITYWLWSNHCQEVVPFIIDTNAGLVEKVSSEEAEKVILIPPVALTGTMNREELHHAVNSTLALGCAERIWGLFDVPHTVEQVGSWQNWFNYFANTGNRLMETFMGKALRLEKATRK